MPETDNIATHDPINAPSHYKAPNDPKGLYQVIQIIRAWRCGFCEGNVIKYTLRAGRKDGVSKLTDLQKAQKNLKFLIEEAEGEKLMQTIGTCSQCGGPVQVPSVWHSTIPPVPKCGSCGASAKQSHGPVIPMEPKRHRTSEEIEREQAFDRWNRTGKY